MDIKTELILDGIHEVFDAAIPNPIKAEWFNQQIHSLNDILIQQYCSSNKYIELDNLSLFEITKCLVAYRTHFDEA